MDTQIVRQFRAVSISRVVLTTRLKEPLQPGRAAKMRNGNHAVRRNRHALHSLPHELVQIVVGDVPVDVREMPLFGALLRRGVSTELIRSHIGRDNTGPLRIRKAGLHELKPPSSAGVCVKRTPIAAAFGTDKRGREPEAGRRRTKSSAELGVQLPHTTKLPVARSLAQRRICLELADIEAGQLLVKALAGTSLTCSRKVRQTTLNFQ
jgi:hypothetical protein